MKTLHTLAIAFGSMVIGAAGATAWAAAAPETWRWPDSYEALAAAPNSHKLLYEDGHVSLLEVTLQPGRKEPMHGHKYPSVFAYDAVQPKRENEILNGPTNTVNSRDYEGVDFPTCRTMGIQGPHSLTITDTFPQHFYRLQFKQMEGQDTAAITRNHAR